jgi:hypothetical protein
MRAALLVALLLAASTLAAEEKKPTPVTVRSVMLEIVENAHGGNELRHGARVLVRDFRIDAGPVVKAGTVHVAVFDLWAGGNACQAWPLIVSVDAAGKVSVDERFAEECRGFTAATEADAIVLVRRAFPFEDGLIWRIAEDGVKRLGTLVFAPQPGTTWADVDKALDHPLSLFDVAPIDAAARRLAGRSYADVTLALGVASPVEKRGRFLVGTGCKPHSCGSVEGFIAVDRVAKQVFLGLKKDGQISSWPAVQRWPEGLRRDFESWRK